MAMPYADEVLVEARGCTVRDADGREMLDLAAGMFCCVLGHNHPNSLIASSNKHSNCYTQERSSSLPR
jgi:acetylornithine/succinyldiaminopimelate/putrescine aminotransferase